MKKITTKKLVTLALLTALEIVFSRFLSINAWNLKIGFNFLPIALAALLFGPLAGGLVGALGDFIGAILFPIGAYFPGFTFTAFLTGCCFGLFLRPVSDGTDRSKRQSSRRIPQAVEENQATALESQSAEMSGGCQKELSPLTTLTLFRIAAAVLVNQLILSLLLNSFWISVLYGSPYGPLLVTRLVQCAVLIPVQFAGLWLLMRILPRIQIPAGLEYPRGTERK